MGQVGVQAEYLMRCRCLYCDLLVHIYAAMYVIDKLYVRLYQLYVYICMREFQYIIVETIIALATFSLHRDEKNDQNDHLPYGLLMEKSVSGLFALT